jgi:ATP-dependent RNA helicase RhlE
MLNLGFRPQLTHIFEMMKEKTEYLFSATMTEAVDEMLDEYFASPLKFHWQNQERRLKKLSRLLIK